MFAIKDLMTLLSNWNKRCKAKARISQIEQVRDSFQVKEKCGTLYLMCQGVPYKKISADLTATQIVSLIDESRATMLSYLDEKQQNSSIDSIILSCDTAGI